MMKYWLLESEPDVFSLEDLKNRPNQTELLGRDPGTTTRAI